MAQQSGGRSLGPSARHVYLAYALMFPGQGSHYPGMARGVCTAHPDVARALETSRRMLNRDLLDVMGDPSPDPLSRTLWAQPAILLYEISLVCSFRHAIGSVGLPGPCFAGGHSLGEYAALYAAGSLSAEQAMELVCARARAMSKACLDQPGAMSAVVGMPAATARTLESVQAGRVWLANDNSTDQVVLSGRPEDLASAEAEALRAGARKVVRLGVEGAFHCPLMSSAALEFSECLRRARIDSPAFPVSCNATGAAFGPDSDPDDERGILAAHVTSTVRWVDCIRGMLGSGVRAVVELGPRSILLPMVRKVASDLVGNRGGGAGPDSRELVLMAATDEAEVAARVDKLLELAREVG